MDLTNGKMIKSIIIITLCCLVNFQGSQATQMVKRKVKLSVYFEALCPDSIKFIQRQLRPIYTDTDIGPHLDLDLVAFGHANVTDSDQITCQHGPAECDGNRRMGCIIERHRGRRTRNAVLTIDCLMSKNRGPEECIEDFLPDNSYEEIEECAGGQESLDIMRRYMKRQGKVDYVPYLILQGKHTGSVQKVCEKDLQRCICDEFVFHYQKPNSCRDEGW